MHTDKVHRAIRYGLLYALGFLIVMGGLVIVLPHLNLSRLAIMGLFFLSLLLVNLVASANDHPERLLSAATTADERRPW